MQYILPRERVEQLVDKLDPSRYDSYWDETLKRAREAGVTAIILDDEELYELLPDDFGGDTDEGDGSI